MKNSAVRSVITLALICLAASLLLSLTNAFTKGEIERAEAAAEEEALRAVMPGADGFSLLGDTANLPATVTAVYRDNGHTGYVFRLETSGFSSGLRILCAIGNDGKIIAVKTLSSNETDGYGKVCETAEYEGRYAGKDETLSGVDAISGATKTTNGYTGAIRDAFTAFAALQNKEEQ